MNRYAKLARESSALRDRLRLRSYIVFLVDGYRRVEVEVMDVGVLELRSGRIPAATVVEEEVEKLERWRDGEDVDEWEGA